MRASLKTCLLLAMAAFAGTPTLRAQGVTTAAITGLVTDETNNPVVGARVTAVHRPSGTSYVASSRQNGRFTIPGMRVGGPYRVSVAYIGLQGQAQENINLTLGVARDLRFVMQPLTIQVEAITITAQRDAIISSERTGAATALPTELLVSLPTITRRVEDVLRLTPQYSPVSFGFSFAGQDNRFNNMTIDGSYFNNSFGLAGQPGDRTIVSPISLDALEQVEVNVAPFDVRQGNFVGAGINMVTRSGTNDFRGSLYYQTRSESFVGTKAGGNTFDPGTFQYSQIGLTLGGPIIRNRLFFFTSYEHDGQTSPGTEFRANTGSETVAGNVTRVLASDLDGLSSFLGTNFNYETGPYQGYDFKVPSTRFLTRLDYNLSDRSKLSLRYTLLNSSSDILESNSASLGLGNRRSNLNALNFANSNYAILENIRSIVGEWNTTFGTNRANNFIVGYTSADESRKNNSPPWFPLVEILNGGTGYTSFGFEPFTPANQLTYNSYQLQDNFTFYLRNHSLTFGVSLEKYHSMNVFFPGAQSVYVYNSLADFYTDANDYLANPSRTVSPVTLRRFQYRWSNIPGQDQPLQPLDVLYSGFYVQDEWRPTRTLTLSGGLRMDAPKFGDTGFDNPVADTMSFRDASGATVHYNSGALPGVNPLFSPRFGFNYDVRGRHNTQIRGGTGIFTGRPAYVWISNQIGNTGVLTGFSQIDNTTTRPFNPDPDAYKPAASTITGAPASSFQLALTDPDFKFPQLWRTNIAVDQRLPWNLLGTAEYLYSRDVNGMAYINANLPAAQSAFTGADNRPRWVCPAGGCPAGQSANRLYSNVSDATVLTNQGVGKSWSLAFSLERPFRSGLFAKVGWSYGESQNTVDPGSIASGSFTGNPITSDPNNPALGYSQFSPGPRIFATLSYTRDFFGFGATSISVFWQGYRGGNSSYVVSGDINGDGANGNDLIYIARDLSEMNFTTLTVGTTTYTAAEQAAAWEAFILQDPYLSTHRGQYAQRGAAHLPMLYRADLSISQDVGRSIGGRPNRLQARLDILNVSNLINKNWGLGQFFTNGGPLISSTRPLTYVGADASGAAQFRLATTGGQLISSSYQKSVSITDVYRMQLGLRYYFN